MEPARWKEVERLFHAALECDPAQRSAFLAEACTDSTLRQEVESLLQFDRDRGSMLDRPAWEKNIIPGVLLGPYKILHQLGKGGMGEVWKALDTRLDRVVAIKIPFSGFSGRIQREARAVAALNHPHICTLYDVGADYIVMECIEGSPLRGPLRFEKAIEYAGQILEALDAAHKRGLVHRDLKPANILVTKTGVKLLDFGIAKWERAQAAASGASPVTIEGMVVGTPAYMAPEQAEGCAADSRSDLFAFGCVLYEMLTGSRAFKNGAATKVGAARSDLFTVSNPSLTPPALNGVLQRCLAKDPEERWQSARDVRAALTLAIQSTPAAATTRRTWVLGTAAGTIVGALAGGGVVAWLERTASGGDALIVQLDPPPGGRFGRGFGPGFALSPNGKIAAYTATADGRTGLWIHPLNGTPRLVAEIGDHSPFWSPDGRSVGFWLKTKLRRFDLTTTAQWTVCDFPGAGGAWTAGGLILFSASDGSIFSVSASGGKPERVTILDSARGERGQGHLQALPRERFIYGAGFDRSENNGIYAAALARPSERIRLLNINTNALYAPGGDGKDYLLWHRSGTLVAQELDIAALKMRGEPRLVVSPARITNQGDVIASVSANGSLLYNAASTASTLLSWFSRDGKVLDTIGEPQEYLTFRLSPDGRRVAASRSQLNGSPEMWILDSSRGAAIRLTAVDMGGLSVWSSDGRSLVYASQFSDGFLRQDLSGTANPLRLTNSHKIQFPNDWSRDGRFILYQELNADKGFDLRVLELDTNGKPIRDVPWLSTASHESDGRFAPTPNPRWVAYMSNESGRYEIYIDSFPERRGKIRVSIDGGRFAQWREDGRELFFLSADFKLMAANVRLTRDSVETSTPHELFALPVVENLGCPFDSAPDGRRFLVRAALQRPEPLTLVVNWPALLNRSDNVGG